MKESWSALMILIVTITMSCNSDERVKIHVCNACYDGLGREYAVMISRIENDQLRTITKHNFCRIESLFIKGNSIQITLMNCLGFGFCSLELKIDFNRGSCETKILYERGDWTNLTCVTEETYFTLSNNLDGTKTMVGRLVVLDQNQQEGVDIQREVKKEILFSFDLDESKNLIYEPNGVFF